MINRRYHTPWLKAMTSLEDAPKEIQLELKRRKDSISKKEPIPPEKNYPSAKYIDVHIEEQEL